MDEKERFIGDKGYKGENEKILIPHIHKPHTPLNLQQKLSNNWIKNKRILIENLFSMFKVFQFSKMAWCSTLERLKLAVVLISYTINISILGSRKDYEKQLQDEREKLEEFEIDSGSDEESDNESN